MTYMDSDILGILLALLTFVVPVISSVMEKKKKKGRGEQTPQQEHHEIVQDEIQQEERDSRVQEMEELFNELLGLNGQEPREQQELHEEEMTIDEQVEMEQVAQQPSVNFTAVEPVEEPMIEEEGIPQTTIVQEPVNQAYESAGDGEKVHFRERLKNDPKAAIVFAEILKPKYKEN